MDVRETARAFIAGSFDLLRRENVIPTPVFHPFARVGRDYYGDTIRAVGAYRALERQLEDLYPQRFKERQGIHLEFATTYMFSFLEACIARCSDDAGYDEGDYYDAQSESVSRTIDELIAVLDSPTYEMVCCCFVSHLRTDSGAEIQIGDVTVVPDPPGVRRPHAPHHRRDPGRRQRLQPRGPAALRPAARAPDHS
jgi:hypothetical protein